ncbi:MAG TPA: hypothetical protein VG871_15475 [Vicinamibacterales bacterium]|nr:hypothetical protein [Vicinamibacterales bacterium]
MRWKTVVPIVTALCTLVASPARSQTWTSTDVGDVGVPGSATQSNGTWTVQGSGADIWGTSDEFHFLRQTASGSGYVVVRVDDLQNTNAFAKAGTMVRASVDANAATVILDVKPDGGLEFMARTSAGAQMTAVGGGTVSLPIWLRLSWTGHDINGWISSDGQNWNAYGRASVELPSSPDVGVAVTSHDRNQLNTVHFDSLALAAQAVPGWSSTDVGNVVEAGGASEQQGGWTVSGSGGDIWGTADAFHFLYRPMRGSKHLVARIDDLQNTYPFAKAGVMLRAGLDAGAATAILDVKPGGGVEFMARATDGADMAFLGGGSVSLPAWLQLDWSAPGGGAPAAVTASVSQDKVNWTPVGSTASVTVPEIYDAGVAVTSHDTSRLNTAHLHGLSLLTSGMWSDEIGNTGLVGNAADDITQPSFPLIMEGAGADIWGTADAFEFYHWGVNTQFGGFSIRVDLHAAQSFAKAGLMLRDGLDPGAATVILDAKPDGGIEFMARPCAGCEMTYLNGTSLTLPVYLTLFRNGSTISARVSSDDFRTTVDLGSTDVTMTSPIPGYAVTSHNPADIAVGVFDDPPR